jgi:DDE superfamily endonuclease
MTNYAHWLDVKGPSRYLCPSANRKAGRRSRWHAAASLPDAFSCLPKRGRHWSDGNGPPPLPRAWSAGGGLSSCWPQGPPKPRWRRPLACNGRWSATGPSVVSPSVWPVLQTLLAAGPRAIFPPEGALHVVRLACERPDLMGRRLSPWACPERARQLIADRIVEAIAAATVRRMRAAHPLQPWRQPLGLYPTHPRDAPFSATVAELIDLSTRPLHADELGLSVEEQTSLQPRPRLVPTLPAQPHPRPTRGEPEDKRAGALPLCAAFDPRAGKVYGPCDERQRQREFIAFLETLEAAIDAWLRILHLVCDTVSTPHGKEVHQWLTHHARLVMHFTPGPCSWMHQVEPWCSSLQRQRLRMVDVASKAQRRAKLDQFMKEWTHSAPPFTWSTTSVAKIMAAAPALAA